MVAGLPTTTSSSPFTVRAVNQAGTKGGAVSVDLMKGPVKTAQISVTVGGGLADAPTIVSIHPNSGSISGGDDVTITGTNFENTPDATVTIGGVAATSVVIVSPTSITCDTPAGTVGTVDVVVSNPTSGLNATLSQGFTYVDNPQIPQAPDKTDDFPGPGVDADWTVAGACGMEISGGDYIQLDTAYTGPAYAIYNVGPLANDQYTEVTYHIDPTDQAQVMACVRLTGTYGVNLSGYFAYWAPYIGYLVIRKFNGAGGTSAIAGGIRSGLMAHIPYGDGTLELRADGTTITATLTDALETIVLEVTDADYGTGTGGFGLDNSGGCAKSGNQLDYVEMGGLDVEVPPVVDVTLLDPTTGGTSGGTSVTIEGTGFEDGCTVTFGANAATSVTVLDPTELTCLSPTADGPGQVEVTVTNPDGQFDQGQDDKYTYVSDPTITLLSQTTGSLLGGSGVTITGTEFFVGATVTFGGRAAINPTVTSRTTITCTSPTGTALGAVDVVVRNIDGGYVTATDAFTYTAPPPGPEPPDEPGDNEPPVGPPQDPGQGRVQVHIAGVVAVTLPVASFQRTRGVGYGAMTQLLSEIPQTKIVQRGSKKGK
jgi:hypothetical protein